jgi:glycosyltransferase involved in cell wall biosynthesis
MKIALCANTSWYLYNFRKNLITAIQQRGHEVYAIAPFDSYSQKLQALGAHWLHLHLHQTRKNPLTELRSLIRLSFLVHKIRPDVLLTFTIKCNIYVGLLTNIYPVKLIVNISGLGEAFERKGFVNTFVCYLYHIALRRAHKVFFQNREDLQTFIQKKILSETRCERLPGSGVDLSRFVPLAESVEHNSRIFLMFGRFVPGKGYDLLLQAADRIKHVQNTSAAFWILGIEDRSRKESIALFQRILDYHARGIIKYIPATDDVVPIIQQADVVVLPSHYHEGVPKSLLEAMACGKPIITTNWKGCRDTVEHGLNGYLIDVGDVQALEKYIYFFIHAENEVLHKMGKTSRQKAEKEFDEHIIISKYLTEIEMGMGLGEGRNEKHYKT